MAADDPRLWLGDLGTAPRLGGGDRQLDRLPGFAGRLGDHTEGANGYGAVGVGNVVDWMPTRSRDDVGQFQCSGALRAGFWIGFEREFDLGVIGTHRLGSGQRCLGGGHALGGDRLFGAQAHEPGIHLCEVALQRVADPARVLDGERVLATPPQPLGGGHRELVDKTGAGCGLGYAGLSEPQSGSRLGQLAPQRLDARVGDLGEVGRHLHVYQANPGHGAGDAHRVGFDRR